MTPLERSKRLIKRNLTEKGTKKPFRSLDSMLWENLTKEEQTIAIAKNSKKVAIKCGVLDKLPKEHEKEFAENAFERGFYTFNSELELIG